MIVRCLLSTYQNASLCLHGGRLDAASMSPSQRIGDANGRNVNNSSTSVTRRFYSQVDRLLESSAEDRERALELLKAKEQQVRRSAFAYAKVILFILLQIERSNFFVS